MGKVIICVFSLWQPSEGYGNAHHFPQTLPQPADDGKLTQLEWPVMVTLIPQMYTVAQVVQVAVTVEVAPQICALVVVILTSSIFIICRWNFK